MLACVRTFEASHGLHSHRVLCFAKCYAIQTVLLKLSGQIFTSLKAQIVVFFVACTCIGRYIYQTCRVFTLNTCRQYVLVIHLNDDSVGYRHYWQCSKVIDEIII